MYARIAGIPPNSTELQQMMAAGDPVTAALIATQDPAFYNNTIRNMAMPWTNRDQTVFAPLNDYVATVIGMVKDNVPFNTLLSADLVYIADPGPARRRIRPTTTTCNDAGQQRHRSQSVIWSRARSRL